MSKATKRKKSLKVGILMSLAEKNTHDTLKSDSKLVSEVHKHVTVQNLRQSLHFYHKLPKLFKY